MVSLISSVFKRCNLYHQYQPLCTVVLTDGIFYSLAPEEHFKSEGEAKEKLSLFFPFPSVQQEANNMTKSQEVFCISKT